MNNQEINQFNLDNIANSDNMTVLKGYFQQATQVGSGSMVLFKFQGMSSYGKLIIQGLTFISQVEEIQQAIDDGTEVTLIGELRTYKNKRSGQFEVQIEAKDIIYHD